MNFHIGGKGAMAEAVVLISVAIGGHHLSKRSSKYFEESTSLELSSLMDSLHFLTLKQL
jgi:hypothetical protein